MKVFSKYREPMMEDYKQACKNAGKKLTRDEYRSVGAFKTYKIERAFGGWNGFMKEIAANAVCGRGKRNIIKQTNKKRILITSAYDGSSVDMNCWLTLKNYAKTNDCDLFVLWGKPNKGAALFSADTYEELEKYLVTEIEFTKDKRCVAKDLQIPYNQKNPLINLDKLSNFLTTYIVGSAKQYMKVLPYDPNDVYKVAWSTGTISNIQYDTTVSGQLDKQNHTYGALYLEYNELSGRYIVRNLIYKNNFIADLNKIYTTDSVMSEDYIPGMVLGDLHLPEEDEKSINYTTNMIRDLKVKTVILHDIFSFNSISHHDFNLALTKLLNRTPENATLEDEMSIASEKLDEIAVQCPDTNFIVVHSNHDDFIMKYLNNCDFTHDTPNAITAMRLFIDIIDNKNPLSKYLKQKNIEFLPQNSTYEISGFEVGQHGNLGIGGMRGSATTYSKTYTKSITAHTHSPQTMESAIYVGTNSKLRLNYNDGISTWAHSNVLIHGNGSYQHIFCD